MEYVEHGIDSYWYVRTSSLLHLIDLDIYRPPPHSSSMDVVYLSKGEIKKGIRSEIYRVYLRSTWFELEKFFLPNFNIT